MYDSLLKLKNYPFPAKLPIFPGHAYGGWGSTVAQEKREGLLRPMSRGQWRTRMVPRGYKPVNTPVKTRTDSVKTAREAEAGHTVSRDRDRDAARDESDNSINNEARQELR